jgi:hypothetical protein
MHIPIMMKTSKCRIILIIFFVVSFYFQAYGQRCVNYHEKFCEIPDFTYYYNGQSKSGLFAKGQTSELKIVVFEGEDYFVSVCGEKKLGELRFRVLEDNNLKRVLFDNSQHGFVKTMTFTNTVTRKVVIEVTIPEGTDDKIDTPGEKHCAGVLIAFRKTSGPDKDKEGF